MTNTLTQQLQEKAVRALQNLHDYINREVGLPTGMPGLGTITLGSREEMYEDFITKLVADVVEAEKSRALNVMKTQEDRWCEDEFGHCGCLRYAIDLVENPEADRIFTPSTQPKEVQP